MVALALMRGSTLRRCHVCPVDGTSADACRFAHDTIGVLCRQEPFV